jgi:hypothetical protein
MVKEKSSNKQHVALLRHAPLVPTFGITVACTPGADTWQGPNHASENVGGKRGCPPRSFCHGWRTPAVHP